jgi:hypothetical protein
MSVADRALVAVSWGQAEDNNYPVRVDYQRHLEAVDPFGLGDVTPEKLA